MKDDRGARPDADAEREILALSNRLQLELLQVLNAGGWSNFPTVAAHGCAELLVKVLAACVVIEPARAAWALDMVNRVRDAVAVTNPVKSGTVRH